MSTPARNTILGQRVAILGQHANESFGDAVPLHSPPEKHEHSVVEVMAVVAVVVVVVVVKLG